MAGAADILANHEADTDDIVGLRSVPDGCTDNDVERARYEASLRKRERGPSGVVGVA